MGENRTCSKLPGQQNQDGGYCYEKWGCRCVACGRFWCCARCRIAGGPAHDGQCTKHTRQMQIECGSVVIEEPKAGEQVGCECKPISTTTPSPHTSAQVGKGETGGEKVEMMTKTLTFDGCKMNGVSLALLQVVTWAGRPSISLAPQDADAAISPRDQTLCALPSHEVKTSMTDNGIAHRIGERQDQSRVAHKVAE